LTHSEVCLRANQKTRGGGHAHSTSSIPASPVLSPVFAHSSPVLTLSGTMSQSAEYSSDKTGDRGGGGRALVHQKRLIRGLLVWATLLTLGLVASLTLHFIQRESDTPKVGMRSII